ncbi:MAG: hypothetical protein ACOZQL_43860 [Myxococcota bacterium]
MAEPTITLREARRLFALAIVELVGPEWVRSRLDATFGIRLGHLTRAQVRAMLLEEFPELTAEQRQAIESEFFFPDRVIEHWRDLYATIDRRRAAALDGAVRSAMAAFHPDPEKPHDDVR